VNDTRFRSPQSTVAQPWERLREHLAAAGLDLDLTEPPQQYAGGLANLNYRIAVDGQPAVLRRPPPGPGAEGANDLPREFRVLSALAPVFPLAPAALHLCTDPAVIGAPFEVLEHREGDAIGGTVPDAARVDGAGQALTASLIGAMAALHALDPEAIGLTDLGRPDGFLSRQVEGWARRGAAVYPDGAPPALTAVVEHLRKLPAPAPTRPVVLHGDLKLDNLLVDLSTLQPVGLIDWDLATRGDAEFDLAVLLSYWIEPEDPEPLHALGQVPSLEPGFPRRSGVIAAYESATGKPCGDLRFPVTLARLRLAVAWVQLYRLFQRGDVVDPRYADFERIAMDVLTWIADTLTDPPL
jgi:aminoglycoside phosphotransferase (APT) family kinase protein